MTHSTETTRQSATALAPISGTPALTHTMELALHSKVHTMVKPRTKIPGLLVHVAVSLDAERQAQWAECPTFKRALRENLAETYPAADRIVVQGVGLRCLETFRPEEYLDDQEDTVRFVREMVLSDVEGPLESAHTYMPRMTASDDTHHAVEDTGPQTAIELPPVLDPGARISAEETLAGGWL